MNNNSNKTILNETTMILEDKKLDVILTDNDIEALDLGSPIDSRVKDEQDFNSFIIPENQVVTADYELEALDLDLFVPSRSIPVSKSSSVGKGLVSIIWAPSGKRITFDQSLIHDLGINETIQIGYNENQLLLAADLGTTYKNRKLKQQKSKSVLYDTALIKELIKQFNLDYQDVTSRTFDEVSFKQVQGSKVALITIKNS